MAVDIVTKTRDFVKKSFIANPHYSFNHWSVMYNHSVMVEKIAMKIAEDIKCDKLLVSLGALLHDIGKTIRADQMTLHKYHENFNWRACEKLIKGFKLPIQKEKKLKETILHKSKSIEMKIIEDADGLAMLADKKLHMLWIQWALQNNLNEDVGKKLDRYNNANFEITKKLGKKWFEKTKKDWNRYIQSKKR